MTERYHFQWVVDCQEYSDLANVGNVFAALSHYNKSLSTQQIQHLKTIKQLPKVTCLIQKYLCKIEMKWPLM